MAYSRFDIADSAVALDERGVFPLCTLSTGDGRLLDNAVVVA